MIPPPGEDRFVGATVAGKYRIRRVVGTGSMGVVCEAENLGLGKRVAIKVIDAALAGSLDIAARFKQEARAASIIESHHIVQVFDVGTDARLGLYLVMEYLAGEDLENVLRRETRLAPDVAVRIAVQAARGLAKAHAAGVVHRDMKPSNIFLARREEDLEPLVKILDFGISKIVETSKEQPKLKLTRAGTVVGTPQYMSPEQAQGFSVDHRTDVWSLGLVLYEMLAGRPAYPELPTYEQFIIHLVSHPPNPLHEVAPWVPEALSRAVHAALEHDLDKRVQSCLELAKRLLAAHPVRSNLAVTGAAPIVDGRASAPDGEQHEDDEPIPPTDAAGGSTLVMSSPPPGMRSSDAPPPATKPLPPRPAAAARRQATQPPPTPRMMDAPPSAGVSVEDEDDAPQFFRRDELQRIAEMARAGAAAAASAQAEATGTGTGTEPETTSAAPPSPLAESLRVPTIPPTVAVPELPARASRARLLWALLIVVLGLGAVLAAVALR